MHALGTYRRYNSRRRRFTSPSFGMSDERRLTHLWVLGKTGMGKSTFLLNSISQDIRAGRGCVLLDPKGDLACDVLAIIPPPRRRDVIYFDPADIAFPMGFNPLSSVEPDQRPMVVSTVVDALHSLWPESWGPQLQQFLEASVGALIEAPGATLPGINLMLTSERFRQHILGYVTDVGVRSFWDRDFRHMTEREQRERSLSTLNKVAQFFNDFRLRNIVGQARSGFDADDVLATNKIFIANLSQGQLGIGKSRLLGALLVVSFYMASLRRKERHLFPIYVDEFQTFGASTFADMLSILRGFGVSLTLAHQYIEQLDPLLYAALVGTVGTTVAFKIGTRDAEKLAPEFDRKPSDLSLLEPYTAFVRTGERTVYLAMPTCPVKHYPSGESRILANCHNHLARPRSVVEEEISRLFREA
jgi:type IV secretory pathway TraG/TraD family ATPase VirD4